MNEPARKKEIAILGGGWGAVSTALYLTDPANPNRDNYHVTIYQMGWRLGGKGASGRRGPSSRIEEHGLHIWMGFYDASFRAIQQVFDEVQPLYRQFPGAADNPFKSWRDAFKPHHYILFNEKVHEQWRPWGIHCPANSAVPGEGPMRFPPRAMPKQILQFMKNQLTGSELDVDISHADPRHTAVASTLKAMHVPLPGPGSLRLGRHILDSAEALLDQRDASGESIAKLMDNFTDFLRPEAASFTVASAKPLLWDKLTDFGRHLLIALELAAVIVRGLFRDGAEGGGAALDTLDRWDFREWLELHGASERVLKSAPVQGLYDLVFGYENGDTEKSNFAAGAAVRSIVSIGLRYKGAIMWKMQGGMGDVVFAPPYLVLKERGVDFKFFHRVKNLKLSADRTQIDEIELGIQATLKPGVAEYEPLEPVKGLPSWPAEPRYAFLEQGEALQAGGIDLESFHTPWQDVSSLTLKRGDHFDDVVLGISIGSFPYICRELIEASPAFGRMVANVGTVRTQAFQLWFNQDLHQLGWKGDPPVLDAYVQPLNTWADMSQVIPRETPLHPLRQISYFCGPMKGGIPPQHDHQAPAQATKETHDEALDYARHHLTTLLPGAAVKRTTSTPGALRRCWDRIRGWFSRQPQPAPGSLDMSLLTTEDDSLTGDARFEAQFFRANIAPSERYVLSLKGSTQHRLEAHESGFSNLVLTGDWTRNGFNAGCIEATTLSGMQASHALSGFPAKDDIPVY